MVMHDQPEWSGSDMKADEYRSVARALRRPVGRYTYERASHLSGVPQRTLHHWAREGIFVPDFDDHHPKQWSFRDLVLVRVFVWLRTMDVKPMPASARVDLVRSRLESVPLEAAARISGDKNVLLLGDEEFDRLTGEQVLRGLGKYLDVFDLMHALPHDIPRVWGPNLIRPSRFTAITPSVMAGEPCLRATRLPTSSLWALSHERGLGPQDVADLYPGISPEQVSDAVALEDKLRHLAVAA
jgi:uncharacterized protein (DUF433 family)